MLLQALFGHIVVFIVHSSMSDLSGEKRQATTETDKHTFTSAILKLIACEAAATCKVAYSVITSSVRAYSSILCTFIDICISSEKSDGKRYMS